jgi:hypothetical protein
MLKKWHLDRIISITTLVASVAALYFAIKKPSQVIPPQAPAVAAAKAQEFQQKMEELERPKDPGAPPAEVHITAEEVSGMLKQASAAPASSQLSPNSDLGVMPQILDQQVSFEGDQAKGQFLANIAGKNVWITVSGHLGSKDGYATFEPTEFKVGDMSVPASLVNGALQKQMAAQRDHMKLPDNVGGIKVEHGELVLTQK